MYNLCNLRESFEVTIKFNKLDIENIMNIHIKFCEYKIFLKFKFIDSIIVWLYKHDLLSLNVFLSIIQIIFTKCFMKIITIIFFVS